MHAVVPGDVHLDCLRERLIPDPFVGTNTDHCLWMEEKDWWYRLDFAAPIREARQRVLLAFEGLDTFATVFLNGQEIGRHANMFTPLRLDVTDSLVPGLNRLAVCLASWRSAVRRTDDAKVGGLPPRDRLFTRKAQSSLGWDITPRLATCGIWREVCLLVVDALEIRRTHVRTLRLTGSAAEIELSADLVRHGPVSGPVTAEFRWGQQRATTEIAGDSAVAQMTIEAPRWWWPHDHGEPFLYEYAVTVKVDGQPVDIHQGRAGIRTVALEQEPLADGGTSFCFLINGARVFLKGMNWTPADAIYCRVDRERYRQLLTAAKTANINALRVWGGGIYEDDAFYEICDEAGILVWHDFMFACGCYPQDEVFLAEVHSADPWHRCGNDRLQTMFRSIRAHGWAAPDSLDDLIAKTQQLQAEATLTWIRHFGGLPDCWGIFLWNLADCWPQVSDAYIAYPFQPKPALEAVRQAYAQIRR
jgi:beta-mannosidase